MRLCPNVYESVGLSVSVCVMGEIVERIEKEKKKRERKRDTGIRKENRRMVIVRINLVNYENIDYNFRSIIFGDC